MISEYSEPFDFTRVLSFHVAELVVRLIDN